MKAVVYDRYGPPDVMRLAEVEQPAARPGEVLVRVRAAGANPLDYHLMKGMWMMRPMTGLRRPRRGRPGADFAGEVEAVGAGVAEWRPGDAVFGSCHNGTFAEFVRVPRDRAAAKPANLTFEQAAAIGVAGLTALQGLRDAARVQPGQRVLITGAAGGVGTFAVQIARAFGAEVTGVCRTDKIDLVRSLGAAHAIDYTRDDFSRRPERYDVLFDCVGKRSLSDCRRVLHPRGTYIGVGAGNIDGPLGPLPGLVELLVMRLVARQRIRPFLARASARDLVALKDLIEAGTVVPVIDRCYPLARAAEALNYLRAGHPRGKVVITT
jgi:NADPH:quinone reductase-like Zn-dependent oxidoreductase